MTSPDHNAAGSRRRPGTLTGAALGAVAAVSLIGIGIAIDEDRPQESTTVAQAVATATPQPTAVPPTPSPTATPLPTPEPLFDWEDLDYDDPDIVRAWQRVLVDNGFDVAADGVFGPQTEAATIDMQSQLGLPPTGELDAITFAASQAAISQPFVSEPAPSPSSTPTERPTVTPPPTATPRPTPVPASISISCPPDDAGSWDWYEASFNIAAGPQSVPFSELTISYGDGRSFSASSWEDARQNLAWHRYQSPGTYTVEVRLTYPGTMEVLSRCTWEWSLDSSCNPNYNPCVPNASDVDCAGGSGNGPAYVQGPVRVIGVDVYGLDRDNDGWGCD